MELLLLMEEIKKYGRLDPMVKRNQYNIDLGVRIRIQSNILLRLLFILAWSTGFLTSDVLVILHVGCLTFHAVNHHKQMNNGTKLRNIVTNSEKV
jgi:hypothetical protein